MTPHDSVPSRPVRRTANDSALAILRDRIISGVYKQGERLPTERALTEELRVHRTNDRFALGRLEVEGLLLRLPNCRPIVQSANRTHGTDESRRVESTRSRSVAFIIWHGDESDESPSAQQTIFWGVVHTLGQFGYHPVLLNPGRNEGPQDDIAKREADHLRYVLEHDFAGVIYYPYAFYSNHELVRKIADKFPLVLLDRALPAFPLIEADIVGSANYEAARDATAYLKSLGHTRIAYVSTAEVVTPVLDRMRGYVHITRDSDPRLSFEAILTMPSRLDIPWSIFNAMFRVPAAERPTAILCVNDYAAVYAANHLSALGLRVPEDVSVVGFDNRVHTLPNGVGLTTIAQPFKEIGRRAAEIFIQRIEDPKSLRMNVELPTQFVLRESVGPPPGLPIG